MSGYLLSRSVGSLSLVGGIPSVGGWVPARSDRTSLVGDVADGVRGSLPSSFGTLRGTYFPPLTSQTVAFVSSFAVLGHE